MGRRFVFPRKKALAACGLGFTLLLLLNFTGQIWQRSVARQRVGIRTEKSDDELRGSSDSKEIRRNESWMKLREGILVKDGLSKVILYSYTRGGSTLLSDVFNIDSDSTYLWYEALQGFHSSYSGIPEYSNELRLLYYPNHTRRTVDARKLVAMTNYIEDLLLCRIDKIPVTTLSHVFMTKSDNPTEFWTCMESQNASSRLTFCQKMVELYCFAQEYYWGSYAGLDPSEGVTKMTCDSLIAKVTAWKLKSEVDYKVMTLLQRYFEETTNAELANFVGKNCSQLSEMSWREFRSMMLTKDKQTASVKVRYFQETTEDFHECSSMLIKFAQFLRNEECLRNLHDDTLHCRDVVRQRCTTADLVAISIHRLFLSDLELLIQRIPDIHIIYYVRDPRAIAVSRAEKYLHTYEPSRTWTVAQEAEFICVRMKDDLTAMKYLDRKYPGSLMRVRYEDLVRHPVETVNGMFEYFGLSLEEQELDLWMESVFHAKEDGGMYEVERRNGPIHVSKWRSKVTEEDRIAMTERCRLVLEELEYEI